MTRALSVPAGSGPTVVDIDPSQIHDLVGGYFEAVMYPGWDAHLYCNANGMRLNLPINEFATALHERLLLKKGLFAAGPILGNAVFLGHVRDEEADLPDAVSDQATLLVTIL